MSNKPVTELADFIGDKGRERLDLEGEDVTLGGERTTDVELCDRGESTCEAGTFREAERVGRGFVRSSVVVFVRFFGILSSASTFSLSSADTVDISLLGTVSTPQCDASNYSIPLTLHV